MLIPGIVAAVLVVLVIAVYNGVIAKKNQVDNAFAGMDAMLKKRHDLIPNLIASVQTYMTHEKGTLESVTAMRTQALSGSVTPAEKAALESKISGALGRIMVAVENYPDLKANQN